MQQTSKILEEVQIYPEAYFSDSHNGMEDTTYVIHSMSDTIFTSLQDFDIYDVDYLKMLSCGAIFKQSIKAVPELKCTIELNRLSSQPRGRLIEDLQFDAEVFGPKLGNQLLQKIAGACPTTDLFDDMNKYLTILFDIFKLLWDRRDMENSKLEGNANDIISAVNELPTVEPYPKRFKTFDVNRHKSIISSLRTISSILQKHPKLCFNAFTLFVEYYVVEIAHSYVDAFKKIIIKGHIVEDVNFWLGESNTRIVYHALICPHNLKLKFFEKLNKWKGGVKPHTHSEKMAKLDQNQRKAFEKFLDQRH